MTAGCSGSTSGGAANQQLHGLDGVGPVDGDSLSGEESPIEEITGEAAHRGVKLGVGNATFSSLDGGFARLPFGVAVQRVIQCHGLILDVEGRQDKL
jgi:hypothetical protein